ENPRSSLIDGRATFTIVWSRTIISIPTQRTTNAIQRERSLCASVVFVPLTAVISVIAGPLGLEVLYRETVANSLVQDHLVSTLCAARHTHECVRPRGQGFGAVPTGGA